MTKMRIIPKRKLPACNLECLRYSHTCVAKHPEGYHCIRAYNHDGPHIACGTKVHAIVTWN